MARTAAIALLALLAACASGEPQTCPGNPVATLTFTLLDPGGARPFCARLPAEGTNVVGSFRGTLSSDPGLGTAALCVDGAGSLAQPYFGRVEAGLYTLASSGGLAVLSGCGPNCATAATALVEGTLTGAVFSGTLTEQFAYSGGDCGACQFPCEAEYGLEGVP